jgi:hypothetical protein
LFKTLVRVRKSLTEGFLAHIAGVGVIWLAVEAQEARTKAQAALSGRNISQMKQSPF